MKKLIITMLSALLLFCSFVGCTPKKDTVTLVYVNWAEGVAMTNLAAVILEEEFDVKVEMQLADVGPVFGALSTGDADIFMDTWLPVTHKNYIEQFGDDIEKIGTAYNNAKIGIVVPKYVYDAGISTIESLKDHTEEFDGKIIGIDPGAGIMSAAENALTEYALNGFELQTSSEASMTAALSNAIDKNEFIAVTGWAPHWKFARWDLEFLKDSKNVFGGQEHIDIFSRKGLKNDMPEIAEFFSKISFNDQNLGSLMGAIADSNKDPKTVAKEWAQENQELVQTWL